MATVDETRSPEDRKVPGITTERDEIPVENPATGEVIGTVPNLSPEAMAEDDNRRGLDAVRQVQPGGAVVITRRERDVSASE